MEKRMQKEVKNNSYEKKKGLPALDTSLGDYVSTHLSETKCTSGSTNNSHNSDESHAYIEVDGELEIANCESHLMPVAILVGNDEPGEPEVLHGIEGDYYEITIATNVFSQVIAQAVEEADPCQATQGIQLEFWMAKIETNLLGTAITGPRERVFLSVIYCYDDEGDAEADNEGNENTEWYGAAESNASNSTLEEGSPSFDGSGGEHSALCNLVETISLCDESNSEYSPPCSSIDDYFPQDSAEEENWPDIIAPFPFGLNIGEELLNESADAQQTEWERVEDEE